MKVPRHATGDSFRRVLRNWQDERESAMLYETLASIEKNPRVRRVLSELAESERAHASFWEQRLKARGQGIPHFTPRLRTRATIRLARWFGLAFVGPHIATRELCDRDRYAGEPDATAAGLAIEEKGHAAVMRRVLSHGREAGQAIGVTAGTNLRAGVLGVTDGLVSNWCLIMGVAGGGAASAAIVLAGVAGMVAGASSMALGEWLAITNSREMARSQLDPDTLDPHRGAILTDKQLRLLHKAEGMTEEDASRAAEKLSAHDPDALAHFLREEQMMASVGAASHPVSAAIYSFALFAFGAMVPLLPFLVGSLRTAILGSIAVSLLMLAAVGLLTSFFNGRSPAFSAARQVCIGGAAAALTYGAGRLVGAALG